MEWCISKRRAIRPPHERRLMEPLGTRIQYPFNIEGHGYVKDRAEGRSPACSGKGPENRRGAGRTDP